MILRQHLSKKNEEKRNARTKQGRSGLLPRIVDLEKENRKISEKNSVEVITGIWSSSYQNNDVIPRHALKEEYGNFDHLSCNAE